jgi:hypothetical protein
MNKKFGKEIYYKKGVKIFIDYIQYKFKDNFLFYDIEYKEYLDFCKKNSILDFISKEEFAEFFKMLFNQLKKDLTNAFGKNSWKNRNNIN